MKFCYVHTPALFTRNSTIISVITTNKHPVEILVISQGKTEIWAIISLYRGTQNSLHWLLIPSGYTPRRKRNTAHLIYPPDSREEQYNPTAHIYLHRMKPNKLSFAAATDTNDCPGTEEEERELKRRCKAVVNSSEPLNFMYNI